MKDEIFSTLVVNVRHPEGRIEKVVADGPRILVGSGAHCDVCLPIGAAAPEHLEVTVSAAGELFVHALADQPRATLKGAPFRRERLSAGDAVKIGAIQVDVQLADDSASKSSRGSKSPSPKMVIALVAAIGLAIVSARGQGEAADTRAVQAPSLWPEASSTCPRPSPATALAMADDLRAHGDAKRERLRFAVHDGILAVELLERAAACFRVGGHVEAAVSATEDATRLRMRVDEEYRAHQLRLEHALAVDEVETARREVRILRAMIPASTGPYALWLETVDRSLSQRSQKKGT